MTRMWIVGKASAAVTALAAFVCLLPTPAVADNYQVTATFGTSSLASPTTLTFDYSGSITYIGTVSLSSVTAAFDSACKSNCTVQSVVWDTIPGLLDVTFSTGKSDPTVAIVIPSLITAPGTYSGLLGGTITVKDLSTSVPETSTYLELVASGLLLWGFRRYAIRRVA